MSKRIIYCADRTWDTTTNNTNVFTLYKALTTTAQQLPFYDDGPSPRPTTMAPARRSAAA
jgi:uncharacterized protein (DUF2235 family)